MTITPPPVDVRSLTLPGLCPPCAVPANPLPSACCAATWNPPAAALKSWGCPWKTWTPSTACWAFARSLIVCSTHCRCKNTCDSVRLWLLSNVCSCRCLTPPHPSPTVNRLKGVDDETLTAAVQKIAEAVELDGDAFHAASSQLSGGMRRRMSLGIALSGLPQVVLLDEPSTGLSPEARRKMWDILARESGQAGRSILLTTHSMAEASALAQRVAIMCKGSLRVVGQKLRLQRRWGNRYKLTLQLRSASMLDTASRFVSSLSPDAVLASHVNCAASFFLPYSSVDVASMFATLEQHKASVGIQEWSLALSSLEDVFVAVVEASEAQDAVAVPMASS